MSMQDPWSTAPPPPTGPSWAGGGTPPPGGGPSGTGGGGNQRTIIIAVIAAVVVIAGAVVGIVFGLSGSSKPSAKSTTTTTLRTTTSTSPSTTTGSTSTSLGNQALIDQVPSAFKPDCQASKSSDFIDTSASDQVICQGSSVPDADGIIYLQYPNSQASESYYSGTLLQGNGMTPGQGQCSTLELSGNATNGTYCEVDISDQTNGPTTGHLFVFAGSSFDVGSGVNLNGVCTQGSQGFTVLGWTDDPTNLTALAVSCTNSVTTAKAIEQDYLSTKYDLGT